MDIKFIINVFGEMLKVLPQTLLLAFMGFLLALIIALFTTIVDYYKIPILGPICEFYVSFFRGTPLLAQLFLIYFGLPALSDVFLKISKFNAVVLTLGLNTGAYMRETMRGAIMSVDKGQIEAGYSVGLKDSQIMRYIVLPQSFLVALPSLMNNLVDIIKGSSLAFTVGLVDITAIAKMRAAVNYNYFDSYFAVMILYWLVILIIERIQGRVELRLNKY